MSTSPATSRAARTARAARAARAETTTHDAPYTRGPGSALSPVEQLPAAARNAFTTRVGTLLTAMSVPGVNSVADAVDALETAIGRQPDRLWLAHAVLTAALPTDDDMDDLLTRARLGGTWTALAPLVESLGEARRLRTVEVTTSSVTCDAHTTAGSEFLSGIQRVVRKTTSRWQATRDVRFVGWVSDGSAFRHLRDDEHRRLFGTPPLADTEAGVPPIIVPWESTHLWVEVITDLRRTGRLLALAKYSRNQVGVLGYDSIPITSSTTVAAGMTSHFARGLAATRRSTRVAMISLAAAEEIRGVIDMGSGRRDPGPEVVAVPLAVEAGAATEADLAEAAAGLLVPGWPMVLVVGSHEPRKNHLAVLHAAELLWRDGLRFNLVFVGAGSWNADDFTARVAALTAAGRPVQSIRGLPDSLLWAAYRLAHCTLFPSLNEGFGLPIAESLAVRTPVITSEFGSMRDIVAPYGMPLGGLLVDPRNDASIADALRTMLTSEASYQRLKAETAQHGYRTWDEYADELWDYLVDGIRPSGASTSVPDPDSDPG